MVFTVFTGAATRFANKANAVVLNRATGVVLVIPGAVIMVVNYL